MTRPSGAGWTWLLCDDCASTIHEVWTGEAPRLTLTIAIEHSPTCPAWHEVGLELGIAFLPGDDKRSNEDSR